MIITGKRTTTNEMITCWKSDNNWNIDPLSPGHTNLLSQVKMISSYKYCKMSLKQIKWQWKVKVFEYAIKIHQLQDVKKVFW